MQELLPLTLKVLHGCILFVGKQENSRTRDAIENSDNELARGVPHIQVSARTRKPSQCELLKWDSISVRTVRFLMDATDSITCDNVTFLTKLDFITLDCDCLAFSDEWFVPLSCYP